MNLREDPRVLRFVVAARRFRDVIDNANLQNKALIRTLLPVVAELYAAALSLELIKIGSTPSRGFDMSHDDWNALFHRLEERIGDDAWYMMIFDPTTREKKEGENLVTGSLGDDLADIYRDI